MHDPDFVVGLINDRKAVPSFAIGHWHGPHAWTSWVMDWFGYPGSAGRVAVDGREGPTFARASHTWHIYAPRVAYWHSDQADIGPTYDSLWFFWDFTKPWPPLAARPFTVLLDPDERIGRHVSAMAELAQHQEPGSEVIVRGHALAIFGEILAASMRGHRGTPDDPWPVRPPGSTPGRGDLLRLQVEHEVMRRLSRPPTLEELAERLHVSVSSLAHSFKAETGETVMERVRWVRVREARRLLARPDATVKSVARLLGFSSAFHLSKVFTGITGMTPSEFMRRQRR